MTTFEDVTTYRRYSRKVTGAAVSDLRTLLASTTDLDPLDRRDILLASVPRIVDAGATVMGDFAATWAEDLFSAQGMKFVTAGTPLPDPEALEASIRWGIAPMFGEGTGTVTTNLSGTVERMIADAGRQAVADDWGGLRTAWHRRGSQQRKRGDFRRAAYQRFPSPGCCDWCSMLASRGAVYWSDAAGEAGGHDGDLCVIAPVFRRDDWASGIASRYEDRYIGRLSQEEDAALPEDATSAAVREALTSH